MGTVLLSLPRKDRFSTLLEYHFKRSGIEAETVTSRADFFRHLVPKDTSLVILDASLPDWSQIAELLKCDRETAAIPLLVLFPKGRDPRTSQEFLVLGDEHLIEPFEVGTLFRVAKAQLEKARDGKATLHRVLLHLATVEQHLDRANEVVAQLVPAAGLPEEEETKFVDAFREAIRNAAQHGNKYQPDKAIRVLYRLEPDSIRLSVTDQGPGFDHTFFLDRARHDDPLSHARERYQEGAIGGLGIIIMYRGVDALEYSEKGNEVTLIKRLPRG